MLKFIFSDHDDKNGDGDEEVHVIEKCPRKIKVSANDEIIIYLKEYHGNSLYQKHFGDTFLFRYTFPVSTVVEIDTKEMFRIKFYDTILELNTSINLRVIKI